MTTGQKLLKSVIDEAIANGAEVIIEMTDASELFDLANAAGNLSNLGGNADEVVPHVADKIEPGAILVSSWGYDQTNIDYYMVTRTTAVSAWIVPMTQKETPNGFMSGITMPLEPMFERQVYDRSNQFEQPVLVTKEIKPSRHKIHRYTGSESLSLTSYSSAYLWEGKAEYASHYA